MGDWAPPRPAETQRLSYHSKTEVCISYQKYAPSDISRCNHATGNIMKYTLPFLLALDQQVCLFTILVSPITAKRKMCIIFILKVCSQC